MATTAVERIDLLRWIEEPAGETGIRFARDEGGWAAHSYEQLAAQAQSVAAQVVQRSEPATPVCIVLPTGPEFVAAFFGVLWAGRTPCPIAPPNPLRGADAYRAHAAGILATARPDLVLAGDQLHEALAAAAQRAGVHTEIEAPACDPGGERLAQRSRPAPLGLLQFTSGSSGAPRGVRVRQEHLRANVGAIVEWAEPRPHEELATWLPLFHDMGLIGCLISPVAVGLGIRVLSPEQFIRSPARWLECFGRHGCALTAAPSFGYGYAAKRLRDRDLEDSDFSAWRVAICGSDRVSATILRRFARRLEPHGFDARALLPAYGLAESTLAVSGGALDGVSRAVRVDPGSLVPGSAVGACGEANVTDAAIDESPGWIVSCGRPARGAEVTIADDGGRALEEGHLGEIVVGGASVADGYAGDPAVSSTRFDGDGTVRTGDAGFLLGGELFVLGRMGDSLSVRGRTIFVEELEARLADAGLVPRGRSTVVAGVDGTREVVAVLSELPAGDWAREAATVIAAEVGAGPEILVASLPPGGVLRTTSGKPRRRAIWTALLAGELEIDLAWRS